MSTRLPLVWCELVCRTCADSASGQYARGAPPVRAMVKDAARQGWLLAPGNEIVCSAACLAEYRKLLHRSILTKPSI